MADGKLTGNLSNLSGGLRGTSLSGGLSGANLSGTLSGNTRPGGATDYPALTDKPSINGVELNGDMSLDSLGLIGHGLKYDDQNKKLAVNMAGDVEEDNTLPVSSALVYTTVGNIQELLKTI